MHALLNASLEIKYSFKNYPEAKKEGSEEKKKINILRHKEDVAFIRLELSTALQHSTNVPQGECVHQKRVA